MSANHPVTGSWRAYLIALCLLCPPLFLAWFGVHVCHRLYAVWTDPQEIA